jgi:hypothetical protein
MLCSVGVIGLAAVGIGFAVKQALVTILKWDKVEPGALIGVGIGELLGMAVLWGFFVGTTQFDGGKWYAVAGFFVAASLGNAILFRGPMAKRILRGAMFAVPAPLLVGLVGSGGLMRLYEFLGG